MGDVLEVAEHSVVTLWGDIEWLLLWSPGTELFKLVVLYLGDGLQMAGHSSFTLGETAQSLLIHIIVPNFMSLCVTLQRTSAIYTGETLVTRLENCLGRKKIVYFSLWEDVGVLQGKLKFKQRADKWKKCCNSGMAHPV